MPPLPLSPSKKAIHKQYITKTFNYGRSLEIFESKVEIYYHIQGIKFRSWSRPSGKCALARPESTKTFIFKKRFYIMWNQQRFLQMLLWV